MTERTTSALVARAPNMPGSRRGRSKGPRFQRKGAGDRPEWLPKGWKVEIRTRTNGQKDKYYADPVTGHKFRSKNEVMSYITRNPGFESSLAVKRCMDISTGNYLLPGTYSAEQFPERLISETKFSEGPCSRSTSKMKNSAEWLPAGWITEIKIRLKGPKAGKRYKCFFAPELGCRFYSKKEVLFYLETGKILRKQKKRSTNTLSLYKPRSTKRQKSANTTARRHLFMDQCMNNSIGTADGSINVSSFEVKFPLLLKPDANSCIRHPEVVNSSMQKTELANKNKGNLQIWLVGPEGQIQEKWMLMNYKEEMLIDGCWLAKMQLENELYEKSDTKLTENNLLLKSNGVRPLKTINSHLGPKDENCSENMLPKKSKGNPKVLEKNESGKASSQSGQHRAKVAILPCRASMRLAARHFKQSSPELGSPPSMRTDPSTSCLSSEAFGKSPGKMSSIEEPVGDLKTENPVHIDPPKSPFLPPFGDSWPDPCIEFAVKTLTGAIPVLEDTSFLESCFPTLPGAFPVLEETSFVESWFQSHQDSAQNPTMVLGSDQAQAPV